MTLSNFPANIYLFNANNRNARKRCKNTFKVNNKNTFSSVSIVNFEQVNVSWVILISLYSEGVYLLNISTFTHSSIKLSYFS